MMETAQFIKQLRDTAKELKPALSEFGHLGRDEYVKGEERAPDPYALACSGSR
jgi:hypothetical protein